MFVFLKWRSQGQQWVSVLRLVIIRARPFAARWGNVHFSLTLRTLLANTFGLKWSENGLFCTFWLRNVLRAKTACTFSTSQLLKGLRSWGVLYLLTWACALRHNGVHFFMSHLARWLCTRRFSEPTFRPSGDTNHWKKHSVSLFAHLHLLSSDFFSSLIFSLLLFSLLLYSSLWLFPSLLFICPFVGSLTAKLPSDITLHIFIT